MDRRQLRFIAVLIAKDCHLFKSPDSMDPGQHPLDSQPYHVVQRLLRTLEADMLEEVLFGRKLCSERYRNARTLLIDEVSNLVRIVLS